MWCNKNFNTTIVLDNKIKDYVVYRVLPVLVPRFG